VLGHGIAANGHYTVATSPGQARLPSTG